MEVESWEKKSALHYPILKTVYGRMKKKSIGNDVFY